ncbi:MAG: sterol desaturase family protein [Alphaproteobacteria bacterium]|jgi:sterol desaturase/sphingolipid hydroxylase (fatty acid hydroxylase superfamily)|uniref:Sterol desaturase family protein n=1 Tax=Brevundimonas aurifodinae TaxID=1508312 RepID=A0ABV1NMD9_9CAUL|nr:sterol desaturase family protein [Alphaproteobacteria bacterium]OYW39207.1 MAG: fatty acid hydroxylase [Brevundimonas sp. 12-68-7]MBU2042404.1 sterol desaturase family protein [Alphaproteobacteria bacterium]MBU2125581.1 sterol desaturase family protein [Alphaproteobacteria bacterium]MBU2209427.1 sterol desaturase family protein [Alphaproteobacteria bacterium]
MPQIRSVIRLAYAPLFFLSLLWAAVTLADQGAPLWALPILLGLALAVSFMAERLVPYERAWNCSHGDNGRDLMHAVVNEASIALSVVALPLVSGLVPNFGFWPSDWPLVGQLALAILVADLGITVAHYASHRIPALWRLHTVHHSVERMYGFNGLLKHPLHQTIELAAGVAPLVLMGMPQDVAWLVAFAVAIQLILQHSNVDMKIGPLVYIWAVAPAHRHHHLASQTDGDVNFGLFTSLWDHLLGTFRSGPDTPRPGEIGVSGRPDYPRGYLHQLIEPFRRQV